MVEVLSNCGLLVVGLGEKFNLSGKRFLMCLKYKILINIYKDTSN